MTSNKSTFSNWYFRAKHSARYFRHVIAPRPSYADDKEDEISWLLLGGVKSFVDVGANDGLTCSNTALAALRGARGLCFEPDPNTFALLRAFYRFRHQVECIPEGVSDHEAFLEMRSDGLLSAITSTEDVGLSELLTDFKQQDAPVVKVKVSRLGAWFELRPEFAGSDLLSIDVEGHELSVLRGIDWNRVPKPARALVIETHAKGKSGEWRHRDYDEIASMLHARSYVRLVATRNNTLWLWGGDEGFSRLQEAKACFPDLQWLTP